MPTYVVFGHSGTRENFSTKHVPNGVTLVLLTSCLRVFNNDKAVMEAFKTQSSLNKFMEPLKSTNTNSNIRRLKFMRQIYYGGDEYLDHFITMPKEDMGMLHGVYSLPRNFGAVSRTNALFKSRNKESIQLSTLLKKVSKSGGGVVFGAFCRSVPGVVSLSSGGSGSAPHKIRSGTNTRVVGLGGLSTYMGLRPLSHRVNFMKSLRNALALRRRVPRPSSASRVEGISVKVPTTLKVTIKVTPGMSKKLAQSTRPNNRHPSAQ